jgi:ribosome biogenesis protein Nip4
MAWRNTGFLCLQTEREGRAIMKPLITFASRFGAKVLLNPEFVVEKSQRFYLFNPSLRKVVRSDFYSAGLYLGKVKTGMFFPSFNFLNMLAEMASNKVVLDKKSAWLFICGRDIFRKGITKAMGSQQKGDFTLVLNEFGECLGFGMITVNLGEALGKVAIRNVLDVGDFLRRER